MKVRILVGALLALFLISTLYFGGYYYLTAIALVSFAATYEVAHVITRKGCRPLVFPVYLFALAYPFVYRFFGLTVLVIFYLFSIIVSICCSVFNGSLDASIAVGTLLLYVYPLSLLLCMLLVYAHFDRPIGLTAACMAFAAPSCADMFAYFGGTFFGKHKLCAHISPKKTVEGAAFGLLGGIFFALLLIPLQRLWGSNVSWGILLALGVLCGLFGQIGDLFASIIKRWAGVKDFSSVFPGHGGMMDRIDSVLLCTPIVLCTFTILQLFGIY